MSDIQSICYAPMILVIYYDVIYKYINKTKERNISKNNRPML